MREKIDRLLVMLTSWGCDKWVHLVAALVAAWVVSAAVNAVCLMAGCSIHRSVIGLVGVVASAILFILKEVYDKRTQDLFDKQDLTASFVGCALFYIVYCV